MCCLGYLALGGNDGSALRDEEPGDVYRLGHGATAIAAQVEDEAAGTAVLEVDQCQAHLAGTILSKAVQDNITHAIGKECIIRHGRHGDISTCELHLHDAVGHSLTLGTYGKCGARLAS